MASDPLVERQRLLQLYAGLSDGELLKLASEQDELTETAFLVLHEELKRRQLDGPQISERGVSWDEVTGRRLDSEDDIDLRKLVAVRQFRDMPDALLAKGLLESAGIECFFGDENIVRLDWFISNLVGGVKLLVKPEDAALADDILKNPPSEPFVIEDDDEE
jgi:hypothetical protein